MPFGPGTYPPGHPMNEGVEPGMSQGAPMGMDPMSMMGSENPLIQAILMLLAGSQQPMGMQLPGMAPAAGPAAPAPAPILDFLRGGGEESML